MSWRASKEEYKDKQCIKSKKYFATVALTIYIFIAMKSTPPPDPTEPLIDYFGRMLPLNKTEMELVRDKFRHRLYRKRQFALQEGGLSLHFNFVVRGCLRMYKIDDMGNTHTLQFAAENSWIMDLGSFYGLTPSALNIDALEDTVVLQINRDDLIILYTRAPKFDRIFRVLVENSFIGLQQRLLQNISSTAEDRFNSFLEIYPHLANRLSQVQIASFLGITPEFLSRLRNKKSKKPKKAQAGNRAEPGKA